VKRFYFGSEDGEDEEEDEDNFDDQNFMIPDAAELIAMTRLGGADQYLLECSVRMCEKSLFWIFLGVDRKMSMVGKVFLDLKKLTEGTNDAEI
jgi:hypothetical protein